MFKSVIALLRPRHYLKNLFVFLPLLFANDLTDIARGLQSVRVFFSFCLIASAIYAFNDIADCRQDQAHPEKKNRPIASGKISKSHALIIGIVLCVSGLSLAWTVTKEVVYILLIYAFLNLLYSVKLKKIVICDVMIIAFGYILRVLSGGAVSSQVPSHWILMTTFFLALFLGFSKRRVEISAYLDKAVSQRKVLSQYTPAILDHLLTATMAITILCYSLYVTSDYVRLRFNTNVFIYTIPFVVFGVFRYFQQMQLLKRGEDPIRVLLEDKPTLFNLLLWVLVCIIIIY